MENMRKVRADYLDRCEPMAVFLSKEQRQDFIDGKFMLRSYQGVPILDYGTTWSDFDAAEQHARSV